MRLTTTLLLIIASISSWSQNNELGKIDSLINETNYTAAINQINQLLKSKSDFEFDLINRKSRIYIMLGKFSEAEQNQAAASQTNLSDFKKAISLSTTGFLLLNKGNFDAAEETLQKAQDLFNGTGNSNTIEAAQSLSYLATLYSSTGKSRQAEETQLISFQIRQKLFPANHPEMAAAFNDLGFVYASNDPDKALDNYEKALPIYKKTYGEEHPKIAQAYTNIGLMYGALQLYGDAQNNFESALKIWKKLYPTGHPNQAIVLLNLGRTYSQLNNDIAAKAYFHEALNQYKKAYSNKHPDIASTYNLLGGLSLSENKFDSALYFFQQALIANSPEFNSLEINNNPKAESFYNGQVMLYSIRYKAQVLEEKYLNKSIKEKDLTLALQCLQTGDSLVDILRQNSRDEGDKIALGALANETYEDGVRVSNFLSEVTAKPAFYREVSFYFTEKSKSAVLLESIADANAKSFSGIPQELVEQEKVLKADISLYAQRLAQKPDAAQEQELRRTLFNLNYQYESFTKKLESNYPEYFNLKFNNSMPTAEAVQKLIPEGTAVISYFIADKSKRLYIFTLTKNKFRIDNKALPEKFDRLVKGFNNSLFYVDPQTYAQTGPALSEILLPKLNNSITDLVLIPSGRLGTLPFEALPYGKLLSTQKFENQFWVNRFSIGYEFSASLIVQKNSKKANSNKSIFLCAPIQFQNQNLSGLPGTEDEVNFIANLFGQSAQLIKLNEATETNVKEADLKNFKYLHFATHGIVDEESPELSRIFLKESKSDDGDLYSGEIYNLSLNADLVCLSACQTGLGKVSKGEGVIGLSRALVYAGARNIMVSFWSVSDESTSQLMAGFYQNALATTNPEFRKNLQKVKIKMISEKKYSAPFYWAPFVLIGF